MALNFENHLIVVGLIAFGASLIALAFRGARTDELPLFAAKPLMTAPEAAMLNTLETLLPGHRIHAQVAMGALLRVQASGGRKITPADRNRFSQKIVDFVLQDRTSGAVVALIEVDDSRHNADRDEKRDAMTTQAGYTTIRIKPRVQATLEGLFGVLTNHGLRGVSLPPSISPDPQGEAVPLAAVKVEQ